MFYTFVIIYRIQLEKYRFTAMVSSKHPAAAIFARGIKSSSCFSESEIRIPVSGPPYLDLLPAKSRNNAAVRAGTMLGRS